MAGQRARIIQQGIINGHSLIKELDSHTPPEVKKEMKDIRGGSFITTDIWTGIEKMTASFKIVGATQELLAAYGMAPGESCQSTIKESHQDEDGESFAIQYDYTGEITSIKEDDGKMGELPGITIEMSVRRYKKTEAGTTIYEIDSKSQIVNLGDGDLMETHRRNAGMG